MRFWTASAVRHVSAFLRDQRGGTSIEYGLIGVGITATIAVIYFSISDEVAALFADVAEKTKGP